MVDNSPSTGQLDALAALAEELRGPLAALTIASEMITQNLERLDDPDAKRLFRSMHRSARWVQEVVDRMLAAAAFHSGAYQADRDWVQPHALVDDVRLLLEPVLLKGGQRLRAYGARRMGPFWGDRQGLDLVLTNLVINVSRQTAADGTIAIRCAWSDGAARFEVCRIRSGGRWRRKSGSDSNDAESQGSLGAGGWPSEGGLAAVKWVLDAHEGRYGVTRGKAGELCFWFEVPSRRTPEA